MESDLQIVPYRSTLKEAFVRLNLEWIEKYFRVEEHGKEIFSNVEERVINNGGEILFALRDDVAVGCCALLHHPTNNSLGEWEIAKMAVTSSERGKGVGSRLLEAMLEEARRRGISDIYLEGNTHLEASIKMYHTFGFKDIELGKQNYDRVDILMRWTNPDLTARQ